MQPLDHPVYKPGDVIIESKPLIYVLKSQFISSYCNGCFKAGVPKLFECGRCHQAYYCSRGCQRFDWGNFHRRECKFYVKNGSLLQDESTRVALRCYILMRHRPEELTKQYDVLGGGKRCFMDLMDHNEERGARPSESILYIFSKLKLSVDFEKLICLLNKFYINSFTICGIGVNQIGSGLYIEASIFDHSCLPNAGRIFHGPRMQVRATKRIASQEAIYVDYIPIVQVRSVRQEYLLSNFYFTCQCVRCSSEQSDDEIVRRITSLEEQINAAFSYQPDWRYICRLYDQFLPLLEQIYGPYHILLTNHYLGHLKATKNAYPMAPFNSKKVARAIMVTHGEEHPLCRKFLQFN